MKECNDKILQRYETIYCKNLEIFKKIISYVIFIYIHVNIVTFCLFWSLSFIASGLKDWYELILIMFLYKYFDIRNLQIALF